MSARTPGLAVSVEDWPEADRRAWARETRGWPAWRLRQTQASYGQLLVSGGSAGIDKATITAFAEAVAKRLRPQSARTVLRGLAQALIVLRPNETWGWSHEAARAAARAERREPAPRRPRGSRLCVVIEGWPADHRARWSHGFVPPVAPVEADPYAAALAPVATAWQTGEAGDETDADSAVAKPARHPSSWRPVTRLAAEKGWGRWLAWVGDEGGAVAPEAVTRERVTRYVDGLARRGCAPKSIAAYVHGLLFALRVLAPDGDWGWLSRQATILQTQAAPVKDKVVGLRPIEELAALGAALMAEAAAQPLTLSSARLYRDGLYITLLAWRPKRISNFGDMRIGHELVLDQTGEPIRLHFDRTKNNNPSESTVPEVLRPCVRIYLDRFRPLLDGRGGDALWVSLYGTAMRARGLAQVLRDRTKAAWGRSIGPHYVRTMYATSIGAIDPKALKHVSTMLDHCGRQTVEIYQPLARSTNASHKLDRMTTEMVEATRRQRDEARAGCVRKRGCPGRRRGPPGRSTAP